MNKLRGEIEIDIEGESYILRPTFDAIASIESKTDKSLVKIATLLSQNDIRVADLTEIIFQGAKAANNEINREKIQGAILDKGIYKFMQPCMEFLRLALGGKDQDESKKEPTI